MEYNTHSLTQLILTDDQQGPETTWIALLSGEVYDSNSLRVEQNEREDQSQMLVLGALLSSCCAGLFVTSLYC